MSATRIRRALAATLIGTLIGLGLLGWSAGPGAAPALANDLPNEASPLVIQLHDSDRLRDLSQDARAFAEAIKDRNTLDEGWGTATKADDRYRNARSEGRIDDAIAALEDYIDAGGDDEPDRWESLARLHIERDGRTSREGVLAAWTAYAVADGDGDRADALALLGWVAQGIPEHGLAIMFYQAALTFGHDDVLDRLEGLAGTDALLTGVNGRIERDVPEICLTFTEPVIGDGSVRYGDYVALTPVDDFVARTDADALCLSGFGHGQTVEITLRAGLPLDNAATLAQARTWSLDIPNRQARVAFSGTGHVLPARGGQGVPLETVNVERVALEIYRLPARGLAAALRNQDVFEDLAGWGTRALRDETGVLVWSGDMETPFEPNRQRRSAVPFAEAVPDPEPGLYAVTATIAANPEPSWQQRATQWVLVTDIGLQAYHGSRETVIAARSLETAGPLAGAEVTLIARNNDILGTAVTDAQGLARLPGGLMDGGGGLSPSHVTVSAPDGGDQALLRLDRPALDLSDRGIGGRAAPGPLDAFLYLERGIYRPGETVEMMALLRDDSARAVTGLPLTLKVQRPDGVEVRRQVVTPDSGGGVHVRIPTADADRVGAWTVTAHAEPNGPAIGRAGFQLEDFAPARMEVLLDPPEGAYLAVGDSIPVGSRPAICTARRPAAWPPRAK